MTDFSDIPLAAGSLTGIRSFRVDPLGRLVGPAFPDDPWLPGENVAVHSTPTNPLAAAIASFGSWFAIVAHGGAADPRSDKHRVAGLHCRCGFYAYFDTGDNPHHSPENVLGLIEGYGTVTHGSRGFRCEKARLVAFVDESRRRWWQRINRPGHWGSLAMVAYSLMALPVAVAQRVWLGVAVLAAIGAVNGALLWLARESAPLLKPKQVGVPQQVRVNYPDVPVYSSITEALRAHPLTKPATPTPQTDPEFWTREVAS